MVDVIGNSIAALNTRDLERFVTCYGSEASIEAARGAAIARGQQQIRERLKVPISVSRFTRLLGSTRGRDRRCDRGGESRRSLTARVHRRFLVAAGRGHDAASRGCREMRLRAWSLCVVRLVPVGCKNLIG
jgi:hypothetical protein